MSFRLDEAAFRLLIQEPFFAAISRAVTKVQNRSIPTAGVCINPHTAHYELHYNPDFFENLGKLDHNGVVIPETIIDPEDPTGTKVIKNPFLRERKEIEIRAVLKHEFYHLIYEHVTSRLPTEGMSKMWNIATDLAINSELQNELPSLACIPGRGYTDPKTGEVFGFQQYPIGKSSEVYYEMLKKDPRAKNSEKGKGGKGGQGEAGQDKTNSEGGGGGSGLPDSFDDHSMWSGEGTDNEIDSVSREIARERMKEAIREAANESIQGGRGWGSVSAEMQKEILSRLNSVIDWKTVLRYFVKTSQKANKSSSMKRINRRYAYVHPGRKTARTAKVAISIDQSGSVSDAMLEAFFAELNGLSEIADFTVIPFDDRVFEQKIYTWKKGEKRKRERVLCGGTNFDAPTNYVNEKTFDGHIILTDLCAPKPGNSKCQRMWMTTQSCAANPYFKTQEKIIAIPDKDYAK